MWDPLFVYPIEDALAEYADWHDAREAYGNEPDFDPGPYCVPIAPDYLHKYDISGGMWYNIVLPNPDADARLEAEMHETTFVNYLRMCFRWAGFPGFERMSNPPLEDIASLTNGLLAI